MVRQAIAIPGSEVPVRHYTPQMRGEIRSGDIFLFQGKRSLSWVIRKLTKSRHSHAGIAAWWGDRLVVLEADRPGVIAVPLSQCLEKYPGGIEWWRLDAELDREKLISIAVDQLGKRFAIWGMVRVLRRLLFKLTRRRDPLKPPEKFYCAQYVSFVLRAAGRDLSPGFADDLTVPEDLEKARGMRRLAVLKPENPT